LGFVLGLVPALSLRYAQAQCDQCDYDGGWIKDPTTREWCQDLYGGEDTCYWQGVVPLPGFRLSEDVFYYYCHDSQQCGKAQCMKCSVPTQIGCCSVNMSNGYPCCDEDYCNCNELAC
jgi:hypothetical protein